MNCGRHDDGDDGGGAAVLLQERVDGASRELMKAEAELRAAEDVASVRAAGKDVCV